MELQMWMNNISSVNAKQKKIKNKEKYKNGFEKKKLRADGVSLTSMLLENILALITLLHTKWE